MRNTLTIVRTVGGESVALALALEAGGRGVAAPTAAALAAMRWNDSAFKRSTATPSNSPAIQQGIMEGIAACGL